MGTRKRQHVKNTDKQDGESKAMTKKIKAAQSQRANKTSPLVVVLLVLLLILTSAAIYIYNFVDLAPYFGDSGTGLQTNSQQENENNKEQLHSKNQPSKKGAFKAKQPKAAYPKTAITNKYDNKIRQELDEGDTLLEEASFEPALSMFENLKKKYKASPRAQYGLAVALDKLSQQQRSNELLERCIQEYSSLLDMEDVPKELMLLAGRRCSDRQTFRGWGWKATRTTLRLISLFPEELHLWNELGVQYLLINRIEDARNAFTEVIKRDPKNGFGKVHLGFIIKTTDNNPKEAIPLLQEGIDTGAEGVDDGRFYFHLGDAYFRNGLKDKATKVYQQGAEKGLFPSFWQRSLYNVDNLTGRPWWTPEQTTYQHHLKMLEKNWEVIRDEGVAQLDPQTGAFLPEEENLREKGDWRQFTLYQQGKKNEKNCAKAPRTCALIDRITPAKTCSRGQVKFSVMQPGVHVWPHCGPTNCRIRAHLGLVVPEGLTIRVAEDTRTWEEGKVIVFDDSFEHEVWHQGNSFRLVLIVDFWHPELSEHLRRTLPPI